MKPDFKEDARKAANNSQFRSDFFYELRSYEFGYMEGANHGYSLAMDQHRDFYLLVREYFKILDGGPNGVGSATELKEAENKIRKHLEAFTKRELESLPFKD